MKKRKRASAAAEMADILGQAAQRQFYLVTPEEMRGLRTEEIRRLHLIRLRRRAAAKIGRAIKEGEPKHPANKQSTPQQQRRRQRRVAADKQKALQAECSDYLVEYFERSPKRATKPRNEIGTICRRRFKGLTWRAFGAAWKAALRQVSEPVRAVWTAGGPRR